MGMGVDPGLCSSVSVESLGEQVVGVGQASREHVDPAEASPVSAIDHFRRVPDPVHLDGPRPACGRCACGCRGPAPTSCTPCRRPSTCRAPRPATRRNRSTRSTEATASCRAVQAPGPHARKSMAALSVALSAPLRVDNGPDRRIVHLLRERPGKAARSCRSDNVRDGRLRAAAREGDAFLAHPHRDQSEDFSVLDHSSFLSLDGHRRPFGTQVNSRKGSGGGKSLRLSATRGMSIGDARNHHRTSAQEATRAVRLERSERQRL